MPASVGPGEILIIKQVAAYLKVAERTMYRLAAGKNIPVFKVGDIWRLSRTDIDRLIRQQSTPSRAPEVVPKSKARKTQAHHREGK